MRCLRIILVSCFMLCISSNAQAQNPDTLSWYFPPTRFAIDADELEADLAKRGFDNNFFQTNQLDLEISGFADCIDQELENRALAKNRATYLVNFFDSRHYEYVAIVGAESHTNENCDGERNLANPLMRRVDLIIRIRPKAESIQPDTLDNNVEPKSSTLDKMHELQIGETLVLDGLNFYPGSHRTLNEAKPVLKKLLQIMTDNPTLQIEIQGHVCCGKRPEEDGLDEETGEMRLSWNRAKFVYDFLIKGGVEQFRVSYRGYAMMRPLISSELTVQDQIKNRRVEVMVTGK